MKNINKYLEYTIINNIPTLENERWIKVNEKAFPLLKPVYYVSNKARIYNTSTKHMLKTRCLNETNSSPYYKVNLQIEIDGKSYGQVFLIHRLMMMSFYPVKNMDKLYVNHKDGNKFNDELSNLEWTTASENITHAYKLGLFKPSHGENHVCATISKNDAIEIRDLLLKRIYTQSEIAEIVGTTESIVSSIATRKAWKEVTEGYDLSSLKNRIPKLFTFDQIEKCCLYFENNIKPDEMSVRRHCMNALKYIKYENTITNGAINSIRALYNKKRYKQISNNFNF